MEIHEFDDTTILADLSRRLNEKNVSIREMEFMTKKLLALNEQAREAESIKSKFLSLIKNEFNNPMSSLLNLASALVKCTEQEQFERITRMLNGELLRLDFQLKNIFATTEIEEGQIGSHYSYISFKAVFEDVTSSLKYAIEDKNLSVEVLHCDTDVFASDASKIYLILLNLLSNACEYSHCDSKIGAYLRKDDKFIYLYVEDAGEGINVKHAMEIYDRFAKFISKNRRSSGLGLGLSVVRGLTESLDGEVSFKSVENNTIFCVKLPIVTGEVTSGAIDAETFLFDDFSNNAGEEMREL
ncbi:MAG: HAMP domain-containing histidine kinase [Helicobacteraceae bacterium]|jgi:K+-sensing histidine kinase KdpD|nr:HAMP domain-containing histidine kinase [Helicobacteraceae bacterium]